jgi:K+-sensing histidine kinase KdpD
MIYGAIYFFILFFTALFHLPTAEAYDRKAQEVSSLQYFSKLITQVLDFNDLAETVTDITTRVGNASSAWIMWKEFANGKENYSTIAYKNIGYIDSQKISDMIAQKVNLDNLKSTKTVNLSELTGTGKGNQHFAAVSVSPIRIKGEVKGILISAKTESNIYTDDDLKAIGTFSDYASIAIENSRLLSESIEKERLEKELDVAREIQKKILPENNPVYEDLEISSVFIPAFEVGGDYYDFFKISDKELGFVIADVSGKVISAEFIMS